MGDRCQWLRDRCSNSSCASACTRAFLVVVNFIFLVSGWAVFGLGVWLHLYKETFFYAALFQDNPTDPVVVLDRVSLILIAVGGFIVTISFLGCCGACTESVCFLGFYAFLLIAAIIAQICVASLASTFRQQILSSMAVSMRYQIRHEYNATAKYTNRTNTALYRVTTAWDTLQIKLNCCGAKGPSDYHDSSWFNNTDFANGPFVPASCCVLLNDDPMKPIFSDKMACEVEAIAAVANYPNVSAGYHLNNQGCHTALIEWFRQYEYLVSILCVVIILQIVDFIYACILMSWLRKALADYSWCEEDEFQ